MRRSGLLVVSLLAAAISGCGGGDKAPDTGRLRFTVVWPERAGGRLIPAASESIQLVVLRGNPLVAEQTTVLARPATSAAFVDVPEGQVVVRATAHPATDGTGTAQAAAEQTVDVVADGQHDVTLTLASTIASVEVTPNPLNVLPEGNGVLTATAKDAQGAVVLVPASGSFTWTSDNPDLTLGPSTGPTCNVTSVFFQTTTVTATETESGTAGSATVIVAHPG